MKEITFALAKSSKLLRVKPRAVLWCQTRLRQALLLANPFSQPSQYETVNPKSQIKKIQTEHTLHSFTSAYIHGHIPTRIAIPKPTAKRTHTTQSIERSQEEKRVISEREKEFLTYEVRRGVGGNRLFEAAVTNGVESDREWRFVSEFGGESEGFFFLNL